MEPPFYQDDLVSLYVGDVMDRLREMPDQSVRCCVTSPPYWGLRDYGVDGQIGLEETPEAFVVRLVEVFREVRRVLTDDGTLWVNLGDSYAATGKSGGGDQGKRWERIGADTEGPRGGKWSPAPPGLKPKDLVGIPWRVAFALQADGWWLRSDIIWAKPNPMPESVRDRPTKAHEYIFLLAKSARYYWDKEGASEPSVDPEKSAKRYESEFGGKKNVHLLETNQVHTRPIEKRKFNGRRNPRTVWTITTKPFPEAHFATFPPELPERCIKAGSAPGDTVLDPFAGAGTTLLVAARLGRKSVGIELNHEYATIAANRLKNDNPTLFSTPSGLAD